MTLLLTRGAFWFWLLSVYKLCSEEARVVVRVVGRGRAALRVQGGVGRPYTRGIRHSTVPWMWLVKERPLHVSFPKVPPKYWKQWTGQNFEDKCGFISYMDTFRNKIGLCRQILQLVSPNINPSQIYYELRYSPSCILCDLATVPTPATPTPG